MSTYRKSSYVIDIPLECEENKHLLIHGYTGAMDVVSSSLAEKICNASIISEKGTYASKDLWDTLVKRGYITSKTAVEEHDYVKRFAALLHNNAKAKYVGFVFMVTYDCNFRCPYCYESGISGNGNSWSKKTFTKELVDKAYAAFEEINAQKSLHRETVTLYGGEPLLKENGNIVRYIVNKGTALGYKFDAVTNGYDLDSYEDLLSSGVFNHLQITLDGAKEMHDSRRYHYKTNVSFDKIFNNIKLALDNDVYVSIRFNADENNFEELNKLEKLFKSSGYYDTGKLSLNTALLKKETEYKDNVNYISRERFNQLYNKLGMKIPHQDYGLYSKLMSALKARSCIRFHSIFCGVQYGSYIFDPFGNIYTCWETVGVPQYILGTFVNGIEWNDNIENWQGRNIGNTPKCSCCKYALLCGGGCLAKALRKGGFKGSYCDDYGDIVAFAANKAYKDAKAMNIII